MPRDNSNRVTSRCILSRIDVCMRGGSFVSSARAREIMFMRTRTYSIPVCTFSRAFAYAYTAHGDTSATSATSLSDGSEQLSVGRLVWIKADDIVIKRQTVFGIRGSTVSSPRNGRGKLRRHRSVSSTVTVY